MELHDDVKPFRQAEHEIDPMFLNRWSPRAFSSEPIDDETLNRVFETARWAASSYNEQPWRWIVAKTDEERQKFVSFLLPMNQAWAKDAPVLVVFIGKKTFSHNGSPNSVYKFDCGTSSGYLALGALQNGLIAHGMAGFDGEMARATLGVPDDFDVIAVFALGKHGDKSKLPPAYQEREEPSPRRPIEETLMQGRFISAEEREAEKISAAQNTNT